MRLDAIELTSDPRNEDRQKAIQGYLKMGYYQKDTSVFAYHLHEDVHNNKQRSFALMI